MADLKISALTAASTPLAGTEVLPIVQSGTTKKVAVSDLTAGRDVSGLNLAGTQTVGTSLGSGGVYLSGDGGPDTGFVGYNYKNVSGTETVPIAARASWREGFLNGAPIEWNISYRAPAAVASAWTKYVVVGSTGDVTVSTGNLVIGTSGKGIDFSATPGTGTSELLADYEEGTCTLTLGSSGTQPSPTVTTTANYIKVGNVVTVIAQFYNKTITGATGNIKITGFPFTAGTLPSNGSLTKTGLGASSDIIEIINGTTEAYLYEISTFSATSIVTGGGKYLYFTISYFV